MKTKRIRPRPYEHYVTVIVPKDLHLIIKQWASDQRRSVSTAICMLLEQVLKPKS